MMADYKMLIGGVLVDGDRTLDVINPATEKPFATVACASEAQADAAIAAAKAAGPAWAATPLAERRKAVMALADAIEMRADDFAAVITGEQGKPTLEAKGEVAGTVAALRHYCTIDLPDRVIRDNEKGYIEVRHKPLGVVVGIYAWNFPLMMASWKLGPAVLAGNTVVLKPAPTTPAVSLLLGELCRDIFSAGVVNVIADNNDLGAHLTSHPDVAKVAFTGSIATGKRIAASGADTLKRLTLELGGNDAAIVLEDVDIKRTAKAIFNNAFLNNGQVCVAIKRAYVHDAIYDAICDELAALAQAAVVGDGSQEGTRLGPIQNRAQYEKIKSFIDSARADGKIIAGGEVMEREGYFVRPTIVRDVTDGHRVVDEEQFGPILPVIRFSHVEQAIASANAGEAGLGGSVWSGDLARATEIAGRIESGQVWVNQHLAVGPHIPMAGFKSSGLGVEQSVEGLAEFTQLQVINIAR